MCRPLRLLFQGSPESTRIALLDETRLLEFYQEDTGAQSLVGSVFLGRVERVLPDVKAAFVKLGLRQNGFLPLREAESYHRTSGSASLMTGQDVLVQVKKDPRGEKGAFLTRDIGLPGQYVLLMPKNRFAGLSRRVTGEEDRARAQALGRRIADGRFGLIVRHAALFAPVAEAQAEAEALWQEWCEIEQHAQYVKAPALLHQEPSMISVLLRDYAARHPIEVLSRLEPPETPPQGVMWRTLTAVEMEAAWSAARVEKQVDEALCRRVPLPGGGSLIIDEREALTTIDVNSGSTVTAADGEDLAMEENLRAATSRSLVILDEIGRGTSTFDGLAIAWAVVEYLLDEKKIGAKTLFATHYHELSELEGRFPGVKNYCISVMEHGEDVIFLRKIMPGGADKSYGVHVARLAGVPAPVVARAHEIQARLEVSDINQETISSNILEKRKKENRQTDLFHLGQDELVDELKNLDVLSVTPMDALNILFRLREKARRL